MSDHKDHAPQLSRADRRRAARAEKRGQGQPHRDDAPETQDEEGEDHSDTSDTGAVSLSEEDQADTDAGATVQADSAENGGEDVETDADESLVEAAESTATSKQAADETDSEEEIASEAGALSSAAALRVFRGELQPPSETDAEETTAAAATPEAPEEDLKEVLDLSIGVSPVKDDEGLVDVSVANPNGGTITVERVPIESVTSLLPDAPAGQITGDAAEASLLDDAAFFDRELAKVGLGGPVQRAMKDLEEEVINPPESVVTEVTEKPVTDGKVTVTTTTTVRRTNKSRQDHEPDTRHKLPREGTDRRKVLELMTGEFTASQIAEKMKSSKAFFNENYVYAHAYCTYRDCGIGYRTNEDGTLEALFPKGASQQQPATTDQQQSATAE